MELPGPSPKDAQQGESGEGPLWWALTRSTMFSGSAKAVTLQRDAPLLLLQARAAALGLALILASVAALAFMDASTLRGDPGTLLAALLAEEGGPATAASNDAATGSASSPLGSGSTGDLGSTPGAHTGHAEPPPHGGPRGESSPRHTQGLPGTGMPSREAQPPGALYGDSDAPSPVPLDSGRPLTTGPVVTGPSSPQQQGPVGGAGAEASSQGSAGSSAQHPASGGHQTRDGPGTGTAGVAFPGGHSVQGTQDPSARAVAGEGAGTGTGKSALVGAGGAAPAQMVTGLPGPLGQRGQRTQLPGQGGPDQRTGASQPGLRIVARPGGEAGEQGGAGGAMAALSRHQAALRRLAALVPLRRNTLSSAGTSCWSRRELPLFLQPFPQPPGFTRALRSFVELQELCTSAPAMAALKRALGSKQPVDLPHGCKYVLHMWPKGLGLGNQMTGFASIFAWALLTNRAILQGSQDPLSGLFCNPFNSTSWIIPERDFQTLLGRVHQTAAQMWGPANATSFSAFVRIAYNSQKYEGHFFCTAYQRGVLASASVVSVLTDEYFLPGLFFVPDFKRKMRMLVPGNNPFVFISRFLFLPKNVFWLRTLAFYRTYLARHHTLVGVQVRQYFSTHPVEGRILKCATKLAKVIPPPLTPEFRELLESGNDTCHGQSSAGAGVNNSASCTRPGADVGVIVTSLRRVERDFLRTAYSQTGLPPVGSSVGFYSYSWEGAQTNTADQYGKLLVEMLLLAFSDHLLTTDLSTIGYVASGISGNPPYSMNIVKTWWSNWETNKRQECTRISPEPCFNHTPMNILECPGRRPTSLWFDRDVTQCSVGGTGLTIHYRPPR